LKAEPFLLDITVSADESATVAANIFSSLSSTDSAETHLTLLLTQVRWQEEETEDDKNEQERQERKPSHPPLLCAKDNWERSQEEDAEAFCFSPTSPSKAQQYKDETHNYQKEASCQQDRGVVQLSSTPPCVLERSRIIKLLFPRPQTESFEKHCLLNPKEVAGAMDVRAAEPYHWRALG